MTTTVAVEDLKGLIGQALGTSDPHVVTQDAVNLFADATGDHQWIHVDPERARAGPFGGPIAHGYLTLSLLPVLLPQVLEVRGVTMGVNYGANRVRFPAPVPVGSSVTLSAVLAGVEDVPGGVQVTTTATITVEGALKPSLVAEVVYRYYV